MADATMRELFSMGSDPRKCFLRGPIPGYITRVFSERLLACKLSLVWSPEELVLPRYSAELVAVEHRLRSRCQPCVVFVKCVHCNPINPVDNPIPVYSHLTRDNMYNMLSDICIKLGSEIIAIIIIIITK
jgi:hypothetical protein